MFLNEPALHCVQVPPLGPVNPALHKQLLKSVLPVLLSAFKGQFEHAAVPVMLLYFPAVHAIHDKWFGPV